MPAVTITRMTHDDVPEVMAVDRFCFPTPWSENAYRSELGNVCAFYLIARAPTPAGDRLVGFAGAWIVMDEAHITTIGVHPEFRRHGIGEQLFTALLREAAGSGVRRASLEVRESNRAAQALYAKFGFVPIARRRGYYTDTGEDAIVMWIDNLQRGAAVSRCVEAGASPTHAPTRTPGRSAGE